MSQFLGKIVTNTDKILFSKLYGVKNEWKSFWHSRMFLSRNHCYFRITYDKLSKPLHLKNNILSATVFPPLVKDYFGKSKFAHGFYKNGKQSATVLMEHIIIF